MFTSVLRLAPMNTLHEIIHENVREGELYDKLDRNWSCAPNQIRMCSTSKE